ncbi:hypothetical protein [Candidatus Frankia alpina]|uniref:Uncharacterized protein n=1 Tax=Candidatus Frankia alpina TaxID=2699483 RepID=A0A4S5E3Z6_9ACTN|nr:hypothetical protein [Candidatus Frankia alpina]THJ66112.1 hypothetical protein E7Y31_17015 [Candidatus Frankia alpina]
MSVREGDPRFSQQPLRKWDLDVHALGLEAAVLRSLDTGGFAALTELLIAYHLDTTGLHGPTQEVNPGGCRQQR